MAIIQSPDGKTKKLIRRGSPAYLNLVRVQGWKDVTPPLSEKQRAHQIYWRDSGQLSNLRNQLQHVLSTNTLLDAVARSYLRCAINSCSFCIHVAKETKEKEQKYVKPKAKNNG